jgi:hypothetical protein
MVNAYVQYGRTRIEIEKKLYRVRFTSRYFRWKEITKEIMPLFRRKEPSDDSKQMWK